jgi:hypothetical protein
MGMERIEMKSFSSLLLLMTVLCTCPHLRCDAVEGEFDHTLQKVSKQFIDWTPLNLFEISEIYPLSGRNHFGRFCADADANRRFDNYSDLFNYDEPGLVSLFTHLDSIIASENPFLGMPGIVHMAALRLSHYFDNNPGRKLSENTELQQCYIRMGKRLFEKFRGAKAMDRQIYLLALDSHLANLVYCIGATKANEAVREDVWMIRPDDLTDDERKIFLNTLLMFFFPSQS